MKQATTLNEFKTKIKVILENMQGELINYFLYYNYFNDIIITVSFVFTRINFIKKHVFFNFFYFLIDIEFITDCMFIF